tara:strand:+ start:1059 stop:1988 length:930 start_codon:yes stop_codon:yes gene_type:complete
MLKQRTVSDKLGQNITNHHEIIYNFIENKIGRTKKCLFGHSRGSSTGVKHEGEINVPIRNFELKGCSIGEEGNIIIKNGDGLQGFCRECSKRRRKKRLEIAREKNKEGYVSYINRYGKNTKCCSICKEEKEIRENFILSPGMECGLHNICKQCSKQYGESMGDRVIKYRPDGNFKYDKQEKGFHDDHIMPLAYGGTNEEINHQLITANENLSKSSSIPFENVIDIPEELMCERWRNILIEGKIEKISLTEFKSRMSKALLKEQMELYKMNDNEIKEQFSIYNKKNNRRLNVTRCCEKFKTYCKEILKFI